MAKSKKVNKKQAKKQSKKKVDAKPSFMEQAKATWEEKKPVFLFVLIFAGIMTLYYLISLTDFYDNYIFRPVVIANASISSLLLSILGQGTSTLITTTNVSITSDITTLSIMRGCDALEPTALFISVVLAFPASIRAKLIGLPIGVLFLLSINLIRIISLFFINAYWPAAFDIMHTQVWQVVFIMLSLFCWAKWIQWANQQNPTSNASNVSPNVAS